MKYSKAVKKQIINDALEAIKGNPWLSSAQQKNAIKEVARIAKMDQLTRVEVSQLQSYITAI